MSPCLKSICLALIVMFTFAAIAMSDYLTADPQPSEMVMKYQIKLNGEIIPADITQVGGDQVRLFYNIDHLDNGKYSAFAMAGNDSGDWSAWSEELIFYRGVPTPQNIGLYCVSEDPKRISQDGFSIYYVSAQNSDSECGENVIDGSLNSFWHTGWLGSEGRPDHPHEIQLDLGRTYTVSGFWCQARQDTNLNCRILDYKFYVSMDGAAWVEVMSGKFPDGLDEYFVSFDPCVARYVSLVALSSTNGSGCTAISELNILGH